MSHNGIIPGSIKARARGQKVARSMYRNQADYYRKEGNEASAAHYDKLAEDADKRMREIESENESIEFHPE